MLRQTGRGMDLLTQQRDESGARGGASASRHTVDPDGRLIVFDAGSHLHLARRRPWLLDHVDAILATVEIASLRACDARALQRQSSGPRRPPNRGNRWVSAFVSTPSAMAASPWRLAIGTRSVGGKAVLPRGETLCEHNPSPHA